MIDPGLKLTAEARRRWMMDGTIGLRPGAVGAEEALRRERAAYMRGWRKRNPARNRANNRRAVRRWRQRNARKRPSCNRR
jgi:hypothetical protein